VQEKEKEGKVVAKGSTGGRAMSGGGGDQPSQEEIRQRSAAAAEARSEDFKNRGKKNPNAKAQMERKAQARENLDKGTAGQIEAAYTGSTT